jgi:hypothetical protein
MIIGEINKVLTFLYSGFKMKKRAGMEKGGFL